MRPDSPFIGNPAGRIIVAKGNANRMATGVLDPETKGAAPFRLARISIEQYHRMIDAGIFGEDDPVELLEGLVVDKMPKNRPHSLVTRRLDRLLSEQLPAGWDVLNQEPITLGDSEPEPDLSIVRGTSDHYVDAHPGPEDIGLVIEVAHTSLASDRRKALIYAQARIPAYWIVNLRQRCIEVHTHPRGSRKVRYSKSATYQSGDTVPLLLDGREIASVSVDAILP
jgi:Uma2 family endonuclease